MRSSTRAFAALAPRSNAPLEVVRDASRMLARRRGLSHRPAGPGLQDRRRAAAGALRPGTDPRDRQAPPAGRAARVAAPGLRSSPVMAALPPYPRLRA